MNFSTLRRTALGLTTLGLLLTTSGCKDFYDVNVDPLNPTKATSAQLLPGTQVAMATYLGFSLQGMGQATSTLVGQLSSTRGIGAYQQTGDSFSNQWLGLYTDMLANNEQIIKQATTAQTWGYVGVAQIQKAYVFSMMVDMWGDIPYSEALQGVNNRAPRFDEDRDIYLGNPDKGIQGLFSLIDEGIANLAKNKGDVQGDIIYNGNMDAWARFGRSLKLKLYNQIRKTNPAGLDTNVQQLLSSNLITSSQDFEVNYSLSTNPENRNIGYLSDYGTGRENTVGRYFFEEVMNGDPRVRNYFFTQATTPPEDADYTASVGGLQFVTLRLGSQGRNAAGNSANNRTLPGVYPVGGRYNDSKGGSVALENAAGVAPQRLFPYFSLLYTQAELKLMVLNDPAGALTDLQAALTASFDKVNRIAANATLAQAQSPKPNSTTPALPVPAADITRYINTVVTRYNAASNPEGKLEVIMTEKYKASFGMGPDLYTDFRRTFYPKVRVPGTANSVAVDPARGLIPGYPAPTPTSNPPIAGVSGGGDRSGDPETSASTKYPRRLAYRLTDLFINPNGPKDQPNFEGTKQEDRIFWDVY